MLVKVELKTTIDIVRERIREVYNVQESELQLLILNADQNIDFSVSVYDWSVENPQLDKAVRAFATTLNAETRLSLSNPTDTLDIQFGRPSHPFHNFMLNREVLRKFAGVIKEAFSLDFTITRIGNPLRGYVGSQFRNSEDNLEADKEIPQLGEPIDAQGDGIRSYSGIAAEIVGSDHPITLLDEPEAFLHPPQAKKLGRLLLKELSPSRQAFVATHSSDFLQGVLSSKSHRIKVLRLDRTYDSLSANLLENEQLLSALIHPSVANSNLLDSLFFSQTVICEGDADCGLFDWTVRELGDEKMTSKDRFWFASGGKHQTPKIARLLSTFGVDFRVILDLDAIADWDLLSHLSELKGLDIAPYRGRIASALRVLARPETAAVISEIKGRIASNSESLDEGEARVLLKDIQRSLEKVRRSQPLKQYGVAAFRNGQERKDVQIFLQRLTDVGIILLPKGELESYVPEVGLHGPGWAHAVLEDDEAHKVALRELLSDISHGIS
ncbi:hypothetical protein A9995_06165 [Erythrobacter sp. QSSC1-22B]|nr:hypothetical protein A9995_06165 [Erythrobacter sp. QSSC1-22B]